jgi:hypothetical protein
MPQTLFDTLAGSFGHGVDRPALNAFVANSQSGNALRSAQTEEAMNNAQAQQEQMQAHSDLENSLAGTLGDDGKPLLNPSAAHLVATELVGKFGDAKTVMEAFRQTQTAHNTSVLSNPANLNTPADTAAIVGNTNKAPEAVAVPNEYAVPAGMAPPAVQQTPLGAAQTNAANATAGLHTAQATNPAAFHATPQALDPNAQESMAQAIAGGRMAMPTAYSIGRNPALGLVVQRAFTLNPDLSQADQPTAQHTENSFVNGTQGKNITAANTAIQHIGTLRGLVTALGNNDVQGVNKISNFIGAQFGQPAPTNLQAAVNMLSPELTRATLNSGAGTGEERGAAQQLIGSGSSPDQANQALDTYQQLLAGRVNALEQEYQAGGGRKDFNKFLLPGTQTALGRVKADVTKGTSEPLAPNGASPQPTGAATSPPAAIPLDQYLKSKGF